MIIINGKIPVMAWVASTESIEDTAMRQIYNLQDLLFAFHHVAIMPDVHAGYGMPIGGVLATMGAVVPNAVGVDIGCGMRAIRTNAVEMTTEDLKAIMGIIRNKIPVGFNHHKEDQEARELFNSAPDIPIIQRELAAARRQLGTLGGGNHFIEIQRDVDGYIWAMIHSGSRNFGLKIAKHYNEQAQNLCKRWFSNIPHYTGEDGLAFLPIEDPLAKEYMEAMNYALLFAKSNRERMRHKISDAFDEVIGTKWKITGEIDVHHNYAAWEHHYGKDVIIHRKGATSAKEGELGIIPGSQGTASYIVLGKGNRESFMSCSHGAGRKMSRVMARKELKLDEEQNKMDARGILHAIRGQHDLDEASGAYKDIDQVMSQQTDLVEIVERLEPMGVIKG